MSTYRILTNNPLVKEEINDYIVESYEGLAHVMTSVRDYIHKGYKLISHPLAGSVKPVQNPYRSIIIIAGNDKLDFFSLQVLESAIKKIEQFKAVHQEREYSESILHDYQVIDFSLLKSGLEGIRK